MELINPISFEARTRNLVVKETDFTDLPAVFGYGYDQPKPLGYKGINDAEQIYLIRGNKSVATLMMSIVNPYFAAQRIPEIRSQAETNLESLFNKQGLIKSMIPESIVNRLSFTPRKRVPALSLEIKVDLETGNWEDPRIFLSAAEMINQMTYEHTEADFQKYSSTSGGDHTNHILWKIALSTLTRRVGKENAAVKIEQLKQETREQYPFSSFVIGNITNLFGAVMAEESIRHGITMPYWNKVDASINPQTEWPQQHILYQYDADEAPILFVGTLPNVQLIRPVTRNAPWINSDKPFLDAMSYGHEQIGMDYTRGTAPLRDIRSLMTVLNWTSYLREEPPVYSEQHINAISEQLILRNASKGTEKQQFNTETQRQQAHQEKLRKISQRALKDPTDPYIWKDVIPYIPEMEAPIRDTLSYEIQKTHDKLLKNYTYDKDRFSIHSSLFSILRLRFGARHSITTQRRQGISQGIVKFFDAEEQDIFQIVITANNEKNARRKVQEIAALELLLKTFPKSEI